MNAQGRELIQFEPKARKSFVSTWNARRPDKLLKFNAEMQHFENQVATSQDKELTKCTEQSFQMVLLEAAHLGLSWNKRLAHCYPIRYGNVCTLAVGYQGLTHLVMKAGTIKSIQPELVCKNDPVFEVSVDETGVHIKHQINRGVRGEITHAYSIAHFANGEHHVEIMDRQDLDKCRAAAKTKTIWDKWLGPQCMKSVIRRQWKFLPKDDGGQIEAAMDIMDKTEPMDFDKVEPVAEEPQYITINKEQELTLHSTVNDFFESQGHPSAAKKADEWMKLLAQSMGIKKLEHLPADRFDDATTLVSDRIRKVSEAKEQST